MRSLPFVASLFVHSILTTACNQSSEPLPQPTELAAKPAAAPVEKLVADSKAADPAEEGCIYAQEHNEKTSDCPHGEADAAKPTQQTGHFGAVFALQSPKPLTQVINQFTKEQAEGPIQVQGQIDTVCQKKGCWLVVKDGDATARVLMQDHAFTVPITSKGKGTIIEGTLSAQTFTEAQVKHLEKDAGKDPTEVQGTRTEYVITATGIEIIG